MRIGSLFSGIGGLELGLEWAGVGHTVWQVEQDAYCRQVLARHWPDAQRFTDVREVGAHNLEPVDVICGGFPCQDISYAGKGAGLAGERSGLWYEFARIIGELEPRYVVVENVAALFTRGIDAVLGTLADLGYDADWSTLRASDMGAPHRRERVFIVAYRDGRRCEQRDAGERGHAVPDAGYATVGDTAGPRRERTENPGTDCGDAGAHRSWSVQPERNGHDVGDTESQRPREAGRVRRDRPADGTGGPERDVGHTSGTGRKEREHATESGHQRHATGERRGLGDWADAVPVRGCDGTVRLIPSEAAEAGPESRLYPVAYGFPGRVARLRALGNAVVPQCAEVVGRRLLDLIHSNQTHA